MGALPSVAGALSTTQKKCILRTRGENPPPVKGTGSDGHDRLNPRFHPLMKVPWISDRARKVSCNLVSSVRRGALRSQ
jgi:hypothetical protein